MQRKGTFQQRSEDEVGDGGERQGRDGGSASRKARRVWRLRTGPGDGEGPEQHEHKGDAGHAEQESRRHMCAREGAREGNDREHVRGDGEGVLGTVPHRPSKERVLRP